MKVILLHNIGDTKHPNYNTAEQINNCEDFLTFDGIYRNVYKNRDVLRKKRGILFIMGDYIGKDNTFDLANVPNYEKYCNWKEIIDLITDYKFELGWHTWSHRDLTTLSKEEIIKEITPPRPMKYFAYPYGRYNDLVIQCVKEAGYEKAYSVNQTDGTDFTIPRYYL